MKSLCFILSIIACAQSVYAQDSLRYSTVSLSLGAYRILNKDRFQSPYTYKGINVPTAIRYTRITPRREQYVSLSYSAGGIKSSVSPRANNQLLEFNYDYLWRIRSRTAKLDFLAGPSIRSFWNRLNYLPNIDQPTSYLTGAACLSLTGLARYTINNRSHLSLKVSVPILGAVYRPDFEIDGKSRTGLAGFINGYIYGVELQYSYRLNSRVSATAGYSFNYFRYDKPRSVDMQWSGFTLGVTARL